MRNFMVCVIISVFMFLCIGCGGLLSKNQMPNSDVPCTLTVSKKIIIPNDASDYFRVGIKLHGEKAPISVAFDVCYLDNKLDDKLPIMKNKFKIDALAPMVSIGYRY
jgi:hypothetical protein